MRYEDEPMETDEIWPQAEGGPKEPWNQRRVPRSVNRRKGARMPTVWEVLESHDVPRLAREIDKRSLEGPFEHRSNKGKGFGGLPRLRP
jgi:hypothetical protein